MVSSKMWSGIAVKKDKISILNDQLKIVKKFTIEIYKKYTKTDLNFSPIKSLYKYFWGGFIWV